MNQFAIPAGGCCGRPEHDQIKLRTLLKISAYERRLLNFNNLGMLQKYHSKTSQADI